MDPVVEKRKAFLINFLYFAFFVAAFYLFMKYAFGVVYPIIIAFFMAMILQRPVNFITRKTPLKKGFAGTLLSLAIFAVLIALIALVGVKIVVEVKDFAASLVARFDNLESVINKVGDWVGNLSLIKKLPEGIKASLLDTINGIAAKITASSAADSAQAGASASKGFDFSILSTPLSAVWGTAKQIPSAIVGIIITIIATCFMTADYERVRGFIMNQIPAEKREKISKAKRITLTSVAKILKAYALIVLITATELTVGLYILTLLKLYSGDYVILISIIIALIDIIPVLGTGTVLIPWAVYSLITGNVGFGIGLLVLYVIILVIRQIIEPKLVAGQVDVSPVLTISAMYIGTKCFGVLGIFILPLACIIIKLLNDEGVIHLFKTGNEEKNKKTDAEKADESQEAEVTADAETK